MAAGAQPTAPSSAGPHVPPLSLGPTEAIRAVDRKAHENHVRVWVREGPQSVVVLLSGRVPQRQLHLWGRGTWLSSSQTLQAGCGAWRSTLSPSAVTSNWGRFRVTQKPRSRRAPSQALLVQGASEPPKPRSFTTHPTEPREQGDGTSSGAPHLLPVDLDVSDVVLKHRRHIDLGELVLAEHDQQARLPAGTVSHDHQLLPDGCHRCGTGRGRVSRAMATGSPCTRSLLAPTPWDLSCSCPREHSTRHNGTPRCEQLPGQQESSPQALQGAVQLEAAPHLHPAP